MSLYSVNDEFVVRLRPIAADVDLHAACTTALSLVGHASDRERTYGFVDLALMRAALPHWSGKRLARVARVLVQLGAWEVAEDGWQFVGWDNEQRSKASRDQDAARQARCRTKRKVRELFVPAAALNGEIGSRKRGFKRGINAAKSGAVVNDNADLRAAVTRDVTPSSLFPSSDLSSRDQGTAPPAAAESEVICIKAERAKRAAGDDAGPPPPKPPRRTRKKTPLDLVRAGLVQNFGELYELKYPGRASLPKRQDLLTIAAKIFQLPDGSLDEPRARAAMAAFLADGWWTAQPSRPGHSFDAWAKNTERYETLADRDRAAEQQSRVIFNGF